MKFLLWLLGTLIGTAVGVGCGWLIETKVKSEKTQIIIMALIVVAFIVFMAIVLG